MDRDRRAPDDRVGRDVEDRREPESSNWRNAKDSERPRDVRSDARDARPGPRDFASLRDPNRKIEVDRPQYRDEDKTRRDDRDIRRDDRDMRRDDREIRRDDREIRRDDREIRRDDREIRRDDRRDDREIRRAPPPSGNREGESNWRSARGPPERSEKGMDREIKRQVKPEREEYAGRSARPGMERDEREKPSYRTNEREREKPKSKFLVSDWKIFHAKSH